MREPDVNSEYKATQTKILMLRSIPRTSDGTEKEIWSRLGKARHVFTIRLIGENEYPSTHQVFNLIPTIVYGSEI
ncbi:hypothetical protein DPMN_052105 [Dreissena polymorpha]|uniref:Uncharacterized protein n=1 Tax=Dreissena polymorpha TaxID=45954 RepID=A0A9D4CKM6_DREPO|nr:hypothetical protein DPMN_052105 [Dreissena polymorpha]